MSSKNLKVYKIQFITEVKDLNLNVKFPCQIKVTWKRSNEHAETQPVKLNDFVAKIDQTMKLDVNMYYDTTSNKFVQKKCVYNFLIITQKGQKAAGSITYDLSEFFNKRIYEIEQEFQLQKCPVPNTKVKMRIHYEQSTESGYDSMSKISMADQSLDTSSISMQEIQSLGTKSAQSKSQASDTTNNQKQSKNQEEDDKYSQLNESAVQEDGNKVDANIDDNIEAVAKVTNKIEQFVTKISTNIKYEVQGLKRKNASLEQQVTASKIANQKLTTKLNILQGAQTELKKQLANTKDETEMSLISQKKKVEQLETKLKQSQKMCQQLENNMSQKGNSQQSYITQLKSNFANSQTKFKQQIKTLQQTLSQQKKAKNEAESRVQQLVRQLKQLNEKSRQLNQKNLLLQNDEKKRQKQIQQLRVNLDKAYQKMVKVLGNIS